MLYSFTIVIKYFTGVIEIGYRIQVVLGGKRHLLIGTAWHVLKRAKSLFWGVTNIPTATTEDPGTLCIGCVDCGHEKDFCAELETIVSPAVLVL